MSLWLVLIGLIYRLRFAFAQIISVTPVIFFKRCLTVWNVVRIGSVLFATEHDLVFLARAFGGSLGAFF